MFGLSIAELAVIALVGLLIVHPRDIPAMAKHVRGFVGGVRKLTDEFRAVFTDISEDKDISEAKHYLKQSMHEVIDLEGNVQQAYSVEEISEFLPVKEDKPSAQKKKAEPRAEEVEHANQPSLF